MACVAVCVCLCLYIYILFSVFHFFFFICYCHFATVGYLPILPLCSVQFHSIHLSIYEYINIHISVFTPPVCSSSLGLFRRLIYLFYCFKITFTFNLCVRFVERFLFGDALTLNFVPSLAMMPISNPPTCTFRRLFAVA